MESGYDHLNPTGHLKSTPRECITFDVMQHKLYRTPYVVLLKKTGEPESNQDFF